MDTHRLTNALTKIDATADLLEKALELAGLVSTLFREAGYELVVVGGSAIEFFTEGLYMSGDIDMCRTGHQTIPLRKKQEILGSIGAVGGPRSWKVGALFIDILGELESETRAPLRELSTEWGIVKLIPPELLIVERVLTSVYPAAYEPDRKCALMLLGSALSGTFPVDWAEIERLARTPEYDVYEELTAMKKEAVRAIKKK
jgi:hypothetical protein